MAGELEERLRGPHRRSECDNFVEVHQDFLNQAADELTALTAKVQEAEETNASLLSLIADIREASGVGAKPMLDELPAAIDIIVDERDVATAKVALLTEALKGLDAPWIQFINCWADPSGNAAYDAKEEEGNVKVLADAMTAARAALDPKP